MKQFIVSSLNYIPFLNHIVRTRNTVAPITLMVFFLQKLIGINRKAYWPTHHSSRITSPEFIKIGVGTAPGLSNGCYI